MVIRIIYGGKINVKKYNFNALLILLLYNTFISMGTAFLIIKFKRMIIKLAKFKLAEMIKEDEFKKAAKMMQWEFYELQPGFINRELMKTSKNEWIDIARWKSIEDVKIANKNAKKALAVTKWLKMLDPGSVNTWHLDLVEEYI